MRYSVELLPTEMKVPFTMRKCTSSEMILSSLATYGIDHNTLLEDYAYSVFGKGPEKVFYAERYGGHGMFSNGGGVRCALSGKLQVKGIGINPLRGRSTPSAYSTGVMNLLEAVREFVWAKVVNVSMPHQSPNVVAVINLDGSASKSKHENRSYAVIRESTTRIATLERAYHFKPKNKDLMEHDSLRVKAALEFFCSGNSVEKISTRSENFPILFSKSLIDLASRHAEQYAAAKVRRLMHGALTGSNSCVDGGWLDFGSIDHLPSFATTQNFIFGFWGENEYLFKSIKNVCHSAELHSHGLFDGNEGLKFFISQFERKYEECLVKNFCYLLGFDENFVSQSHSSEIRHLVNISRRIAAEAFTPATYQLNSMEILSDHPSRSGLSLAFLSAQVIGQSDDNFSGNNFCFMPDGLITSLRAISNAYESYARSSGIPVENAFLALVATSARRTSYLSALNSTEMNRTIESLPTDGPDLKEYVSMLLGEAMVAFNARPGWNTEVGSINGNTYVYHPHSGRVTTPSGEEITIDAWNSVTKAAPAFTKKVCHLIKSSSKLQ